MTAATCRKCGRRVGGALDECPSPESFECAAAALAAAWREFAAEVRNALLPRGMR